MSNPLTRFLDRLVYNYASRRFNAARVDRTTSDWIVSPIKTNDDIKASLTTLVLRSRDLSKNNSDYRKWLSMRRKNVVGAQGMRLQAKVYNPPVAANQPPQQDHVANAIIESEWRQWGDATNRAVAICGRHTWLSFHELVDRTWAVDGEAFVQILRGAPNPWAISFQLIDSLLVDVTYNVPQMPDGRSVVMGVELDRQLRPLAYHVLTEVGFYAGSNRVRIPAGNMLHLYRQEFAGQVRGFPQASAAILDMNMSAGYREAELIAARVAACNMGVWERPANVGGKLNLDDSGKETGKATMDMEPGKFAIAPKGWTMKPLTPSHPGVNVAAFLKSIQRAEANGFDVAYNDFANDLEGVSFSSIRSGTLSERDGWKMEQQFEIDFFCQPVRHVWLEQLLLTGKTPLPFSKLAKFDRAAFTPRRWDWVDPLRDVKADAAAVEMGVLTPQEIIRDAGRDPDEVLEELAAWNALVKSHGLTLGNSVAKGISDNEEPAPKGQ